MKKNNINKALKKIGNKSFTGKETLNNDSKTNQYDLNNKIKEFISWCDKNLPLKIKNYSHYLKKDESTRIKNFIEKMAIWYELRYPNSEINKIIPYHNWNDEDITKIMFNRNIPPKTNELSNDEHSNLYNCEEISWSSFFDLENFVKFLSQNEKNYLSEIKFSNQFFLNDCPYGYLKFTNEGIVEKAYSISFYQDSYFEDTISSIFIGKNAQETVDLLNKCGMTNDAKRLEKILETYNNEILFKEKLLDCVMYKIIERGGNRIGPRRAFIFAKEFQRSIDIPMIYGVDYNDPFLKKFINEYLNSGGSTSLICFINYDGESKKTELDTRSIEEIINKDKIIHKENKQKKLKK